MKRRTPVRKSLGKSIYSFKANYIVLDIETTALDYSNGDIIEICAKKYVNREFVSELNTLVNPHKKISPFTTQLTGISNEMVSSSPSLNDVLIEFHAFVEGYMLVAHNASFDINFIYDASIDLLNRPLINDYLDTLTMARKYVHDVPNYKLKTLAAHFKIMEPNHRAEQDVDVTNTLYNILYNLSLTHAPNIIKHKYDRFAHPTVNVDVEDINPDNPFFGKYICFTGKMIRLTKLEASQIVVNLGATLQNNVNTKTSFLILGDEDYQKSQFGGKSTKHKNAEKLVSLGHSIAIISEDEFLQLIEQEN